MSAEPTTPPCCDCGQPSTGRIYINRFVSGDRRYLCLDCLEEDVEEAMRPPCIECGGHGYVWGEPCEWCDGDGTE